MQRSFWSTIRGKLISRTLPLVLVPLLLIGGVAIVSLVSLSRSADDSVEAARTSLSESVVGARVADAASQIAREIAINLDERVDDVQGWVRDPAFIQAAHDNGTRAAELGLVGQEIEALEARFVDDPRIGNSGVENELRRIIEADIGFKEVFITDVHGFNVDFSNPTSDFVQSDEDWWRRAMQEGVHISAPEFDASSGVFAVDLSMRLDDGDEPVGVLKSSLDIELVQTIASRFTGGADVLDVSIMGPDGLFLAQTSSDHDPAHIMSAAYVSADAVFANPAIGEALAPNGHELHPEGFSIFQDRVGGFAHVGEAVSDLRADGVGDLRVLDWTVVVEQPTQVAFASLAPLEGLADDVRDTSSTLTLLLAVSAIIASLVAAIVATIVGRRLVEPISRLRDAAFQASEVTLPNVVAQIDELEGEEELPEIEPLALETGDEVEDLAHSFNSMQRRAVDLAAEQAHLRRRNVATTFVSLGRRNQNLLARQLEHINLMEANETDADSLRRLFQLDHLATRMRRNAESLLVLAGEDTPRRFRRPVSVHQVIQAAGGEIEDFSRIRIESIDHALIDGAVASDVAHLLAELLENASLFSPPDSAIQVQGRAHSGGYWMAIVDHGIGMSEADMTGANHRLANPAEFDRSPSAYLGHFVVGHLARRHSIQVWLTATANGSGVTANLNLPPNLLADPAGVEIIEPDALEQAGGATETAWDSEIAVLEAAVDDEADPGSAQFEAPVSEATGSPTPATPADSQPDTSGPVQHILQPAPVTEQPAPAPAVHQPQRSPQPAAPVAPAPVAEHPPAAPAAPTPAAEHPPAAPAAPTPAAEHPAPATPPAPAPAAEHPPAAPAAPAPAAEHPAPATPPAPAVAPTAPVAQQTPAVTESLPEPQVAPAEPALAAPANETTPSGFRRRRRGHEGAPTIGTPSTTGVTSTPRRSPEEVQASMERFRRGVEAGKAQAIRINAEPATEGDDQ